MNSFTFTDTEEPDFYINTIRKREVTSVWAWKSGLSGIKFIHKKVQISNRIPGYNFSKRDMIEDIIIDLIGPGIGLVSLLGCLVGLNMYLKELRAEPKQLLNTLFIHNAIALGLSCIMSGWEGPLICLGRYITTLPTYTMTITSMPILSYMRYYITMKTQNTEAIDKDWLQKIVTATYLGTYSKL